MQASADFPKYALYSFNSVPHVQIYLPVTFIQQYSIGNLSCIIQPKFVPNILNFFILMCMRNQYQLPLNDKSMSSRNVLLFTKIHHVMCQYFHLFLFIPNILKILLISVALELLCMCVIILLKKKEKKHNSYFFD